MNLKEKFNNLPAERSYEEITGDAEKYLLAAASYLAGKQPEDFEGDLSLHGTNDGSHFHIVVDGESKVVINSDDEGHVQIKLDDTDEVVDLNEQDAEELNEILISKVKEIACKRTGGCPVRAAMLSTLKEIAKSCAIPEAVRRLREEGKDPKNMTISELEQYIESMLDSDFGKKD